ncbi:MAG TPA: hypothetical protein VLB47_06150, partial [Solirubrobacteraceae bacterium]|nr:hypothetical protein [Solirubrobacteraceae bacterium]
DRRFGSIVLGTGAGKGAFRTGNTAATLDRTIPDGDYYWRVRAVGPGGTAGRWSAVRALAKRWSAAPQLVAPTDDLTVSWPLAPLALQWTAVAHAVKYQVAIATDPALSNLVLGTASKPAETYGTVLAFPASLAPGRYYWAITPVDARGHKGTRSRVASFAWNWPTALAATQLRVADLDGSAEVLDPQLSWEPVLGAARYDVEISTARDFPAGSIVCCSDRTIGTSLSPAKVLANNTGSGVPGDPEQFGYWWRVRAVDADGNAGVWNAGPPFDKTYPATIGGLHLRDNLGDPATDADAGTPSLLDTSVPVVTWDPVAGASDYEVDVAPYETVGMATFCNWSATLDHFDGPTASTAWTPLRSPGGHRPTGITDIAPEPGAWMPADGHSYCVRVRARRDTDAKGKRVVSDWTTVNGGTAPAFRYVAAAAGSPSTLTAGASTYREPAPGEQRPAMPVFTWNPVPGAQGYFVVVARDEQFTKLADLAYTNVPAFAMRDTLPDETTSYWWAVVPTAAPDGNGAPTPPTGNAPQRFLKSSVPPTPMAPAGGEVVGRQPTFRWQPSLGARNYTLQVSQDPSFGDPVASVVTASSAYTSSATFPADTVLYWRVRANDENGIGLNWSAAETFRRTLPAPSVASGNPAVGTAIPLLRWNPVQGAVSYGVHVDQPDGTRKDFTVRSTAFAPTEHYGTGIWRWKVRADFPTTGAATVSGAYFAPQDFLRRIDAPTGVLATKTRSRLLVSWSPDPAATQYRIEVSDTNGFVRLLDAATTDNTSWAPDLSRTAYR